LLRHFSSDCEYNGFEISALLRLATKYDAQKLRAHLVKHLCQIFPTSPFIADYDLAQPRRRQFDAIDIMVTCNVVNQLKLERLAASLMFVCAVDLSPAVIMEGNCHNCRTVELDAWCKRSVLKVRSDILKLLEAFFRPWTDYGTLPGCVTQWDCRPRGQVLKDTVFSLDWDEWLNIPPWSLDDRVSEPSATVRTRHHWDALSSRVQLCAWCKNSFGEKYMAMRQEIWRAVPDLVGMSHPWDNLRD
jgi:hypothetical protein